METLIWEIFLKSLFEKKKTINFFLMTFYIFYESGVKIIIKWIINNFFKDIC